MNNRASPAIAGDRLVPPSKGERQRRNIVDTVRELVAEVPIAELTVAQITERARIKRSVFYVYFGSKYAALAVALAEAVEELETAMMPLEHRLPDESVDVFLFHLLTRAAVVNFEHLPVVRAAVQASTLDPQIAGLVERLLAALSEHATELLQSEIDAERAHPPANAELGMTVRMLIGMTVLAGQNLNVLTGEAGLDQAIHAMVGIWHRVLWGSDT